MDDDRLKTPNAIAGGDGDRQQSMKQAVDKKMYRSSLRMRDQDSPTFHLDIQIKQNDYQCKSQASI